MKLKDYSSSARQLGLYSRCAALAWTARWGWSAGVVMDAVGGLGGKSRGLAKSLFDGALLRKHEWSHSTHINHYYTLSPQGWDYLYENLDQANEIAAKFDYPRVVIPKKSPRFQSGIAVHNLFTQLIGVISLLDEKNGRPESYKTNVECAGMQKIPDMLIQRKCGLTDYIEFEYSKKSHSEIQNFLINYYFMLNKAGAENDRVNIYFSSSSLMSPFSRFWRSGSVLSEFQRNEKGQWRRALVPVELPEGDYLQRLHSTTSRWPDLLARLAGLPRLTPRQSTAPVTAVVDW